MRYIGGFVYSEGRMRRGYARTDGAEWSVEIGDCPAGTDFQGVMVPPLVNGHTHCADAGVRPERGMGLLELVAPPDGLKHRYLRETPPAVIGRDMRRYGEESRENGIAVFLDFREGGEAGCRLLRSACPDAAVLGRPLSGSFDQSELDGVLSVSDGLALSSVTDVGPPNAGRAADAAHRAEKVFAIHASERAREDIDTILSMEPAFVVHMAAATDGDMRKCADAGVPIVVCARSNRFFGIVPPIKRMLNAGCDVALGTDNAMLCGPDMRPEAAEFASVLSAQGGDPSDVWRCLVEGGKKILNQPSLIALAKKTEEEIVVLPCPGGSPESALASGGAVRPLIGRGSI